MLPSAVRAQQLRTLSSIIYSVGVFIIAFLAVMQILTQLNIKVEPLLASAGIAGLAIGFGAQTLVKDFINGFFVLVENQYDIGDTVQDCGSAGRGRNHDAAPHTFCAMPMERCTPFPAAKSPSSAISRATGRSSR